MADEHIPRTIPRVTTLRALFTHHLDFQSVPRRSFFELIRHFATDEMERAKLFEFCQEGGEGAVRSEDPAFLCYIEFPAHRVVFLWSRKTFTTIACV
jgi:sulfite reductase alpha subunit-like flavoprotein